MMLDPRRSSLVLGRRPFSFSFTDITLFPHLFTSWSSPPMMYLVRCFLLATYAWKFGGAMTPRQPIGCTSSSNGNGMVDDWVQAKCGPTGQQLWKYQGALYDPLDGRRVASVEGLEWVSLLRSNETADRPIYAQVLNHPNATWKCAASMWSKHLFCYTLGEGGGGGGGGETTSNNVTRLLRTIRVRPYSPEKLIPLDQAAAVYETATTLIERTNGELLVHSEWPSLLQSGSSSIGIGINSKKKKQNQTIHVWGTATSTTRNLQDGTLGFSIYCKRRAPNSPLFLPDLSKKECNQATTTTASNTTTSSMVVSPKRAKLIQFGISNMENKHNFGARETYSMSNIILTSRNYRRSSQQWLPWNWFGSTKEEQIPRLLKYTRYGEGPPFYAPGRMCMLELQAEPIDSLEQASPVVQELLRTRVQGWNRPTFFGQANSTTTTSSSSSSSDNNDETALQLLLPHEEFSQTQRRWNLYKGHTLAAWERVRSVTNVVSFFRKERGFWTAGGG